LFSIHVIAAIAATFRGFTLPVNAFCSIVGGVIPLAASLIATYNQRTAARIYLWITPIATLLFLLFARAFGGILQSAAIFFGAILVPLFFWRRAARRNWPPLLRASLYRRPRLAASLGYALFCVLLVVAFFWSLGLPWWDPIADCGGSPLLDERGVPNGIDFTARIVFVGPRTFQGWSLAMVGSEHHYSRRIFQAGR
jgi:hypothetical protein